MTAAEWLGHLAFMLLLVAWWEKRRSANLALEAMEAAFADRRAAEQDRREAYAACQDIASTTVEFFDLLGYDDHPDAAIRGAVRKVRSATATAEKRTGA